MVLIRALFISQWPIFKTLPHPPSYHDSCELSLIYLVVAREVRVKNSKNNLDDLVWNYSIASTN